MSMFRDRRDAGQRLAARLEYLRDENPIVLGLPRGGVPVAAEVAHALGAPLDVIVVRKLGVPHQPELGMGAIGEEGARFLNEEVIRLAGVGPDELAAVEREERVVVERRAKRFRGDRPALDLSGRTVILVDDGIATGGTAQAALQVARAKGAQRVVLAVPVAPSDSLQALATAADEIVCLETPPGFFAVGQWYRDFTQTTDAEVVALLSAATPTPVATTAADDPPLPADRDVDIAIGSVELSGHLTVPGAAVGVVVFAHGSGSSRHSPRNQWVARVLNRGGVATLLFDLLTRHEEVERANVFDVELLAERLTAVTDWLVAQPDAAGLPVGYFGASTGAAAALWAATDRANVVRAVVSRGGRPDLAAPRLGQVQAPTMLIVGGRDHAVLDLNREAAAQLQCEHRVEIVPGATHLFEEPGALDAVAGLAQAWFIRHLTPHIGDLQEMPAPTARGSR
jgi:putative phosphoribosyl transferase